jgi:hypothetical protein
MSYLDGDSTLLATCQMLMTMVCGYAQMRYTCGYYKAGRTVMPPGFYRLAFVEFPTIESGAPDPRDPHAFGPPGSGSISERYGSGSGSFYQHAKIVRKTLIPTAL